MKTRILTGPIKPPMIFFPPDTGGGGGGGGEGGAAGAAGAVADPPSGGEGGDGGDGGDIYTFAAPDPGEVDLSIKSGKEPPPPGKKEEKKDPADPEPKPKPGEKQPVKKGGVEPIENLRKEYAETKAKLEAAEKKLTEGDPRLAVLEKERDDAKKELTAERERIAKLEERNYLANPEVTKDLTAMDAAYDEKADSFYSSVPEIDQSRVNALLREYAKLPRGKEGYREARQLFEAEVNKILGSEEDVPHRRLDKTMDWIEDSYQFALKRNAKKAEIEGNARKLGEEAESKSYATRKSSLAAAIERASVVPEDMEKTDPMHPKVLIAKFGEVLKPEEMARIKAGIPDFVHRAILGVPPRSHADYAGMTDDQIAASRARESDLVNKAKQALPDVVYNGLIALRLLSATWTQNQKLRERLAAKQKGEPPDPDGGGPEGGEGDDNSLENIMPDLSKLTFA